MSNDVCKVCGTECLGGFECPGKSAPTIDVVRKFEELTDREQEDALEVLHQARNRWVLRASLTGSTEEYLIFKRENDLLESAIRFVDNSRRKFKTK